MAKPEQPARHRVEQSGAAAVVRFVRTVDVISSIQRTPGAGPVDAI
jgi:hypothetical protein